MKTLKILVVVVLILLVTFPLVQAVQARHYGGGHGGSGRGYYGGYAHGYGHGYYGRYGYGWWGYPYRWGYPYWWSYPYWWGYSYYPYSYPYPYLDPYYYGGYGEDPVPPQEFTPSAKTERLQPSYWHFCQDPEGYYPYVKKCLGGWMTVVPSKPNAPPPAKLGAPVTAISPRR